VGSRHRKKGKAPEGKYAQIPVSPAKLVLSKLSATEFRVWFALCLQCQHWSNGTGKLCRSVIREFHLGSQRVVTAATKKLIEERHIIKTRSARQRVCALYGVTHLPLNADALADAGLDGEQIRATLRRFAECVSATNRGSANSATTTEALKDKTDIRGSAKHVEAPLVLPQGKRIGPFSTPLALPQGNTSKNLPSGERSDAAPVPHPDPLLKTAHSPIRELNVRIGNARKLLAAAPGTDNAKLKQLYQLTDEQVQQLKASNA
jgi:hypothetical protein